MCQIWAVDWKYPDTVALGRGEEYVSQLATNMYCCPHIPDALYVVKSCMMAVSRLLSIFCCPVGGIAVSLGRSCRSSRGGIYFLC